MLLILNGYCHQWIIITRINIIRLSKTMVLYFKDEDHCRTKLVHQKLGNPASLIWQIWWNWSVKVLCYEWGKYCGNTWQGFNSIQNIKTSGQSLHRAENFIHLGAPFHCLDNIKQSYGQIHIWCLKTAARFRSYKIDLYFISSSKIHQRLNELGMSF